MTGGGGWPSGRRGESRVRGPGTVKREETKEGRELHCSTRPWITASTISRFARAIPFPASRRGTPCTHDICDALYIYSAIAAGTRDETEGKSPRQSPLVHRAACLLFPRILTTYARSRCAGREKEKLRPDEKESKEREERDGREKGERGSSALSFSLSLSYSRPSDTRTRPRIRSHACHGIAGSPGYVYSSVTQGRVCGCFKRRLRGTPAGVYVLSRHRAHVYALVITKAYRSTCR
ncbi:hypothetical protein ALC62_06115 [Cyphomyrmex costatus]|uniref:Uncharacterized protein n=1 Tax=Cyphomyrmex costatus TaxID=456900 RepID=A0A195CQP0_9HYME|nr:hypothetical protein ALC62_06115 [Cyphomyrmex costatus]